MDFNIDLLYLSLCFPLWTCLLIFVLAFFYSENSKKIALLFTMLGIFTQFITAFWGILQNLSYENNFSVIAINDNIFSYGIATNKLSFVLIMLFAICSALCTSLVYLKNHPNFYRYLFLVNLLNVSVMSFLLSSTFLQLCVFLVFVPVIFYLIENMENDNHERAKNFLVVNKIGDFTLLIPMCALFYYNVWYNLAQNGEAGLSLYALDNIYESIYAIADKSVFLMLILLLFVGILIKTIFVYIHPLKNKTTLMLFGGWSAVSSIYFLYWLYPMVQVCNEALLLLIIFALVLFIFTVVTVILKCYCHDFVVEFNNKTARFVKNTYLKVAKTVKFFDKQVLDNIYENISKVTQISSVVLKLANDKNTLIAFVVNIVGISLLILVMWILYNYMMVKG